MRRDRSNRLTPIVDVENDGNRETIEENSKNGNEKDWALHDNGRELNSAEIV